MKWKYLLIAIIMVSVLGTGCKSIYSGAPIPTYVYIDSFHFVAQPYNKTFSSSNNICCAWVYYNNSPVGVFDLPVTFPVITTGAKGTLLVEPAIKQIGNSNFQTVYPFYTFDTMTLNTNPGNTSGYIPKTQYNAAAKFQLIDDFDIGSSFTVVYGSDSIVQDTNKAMVFEGRGSGYLNVRPNDTTVNVSRKNPFTIPAGNPYIELDYKGTAPFYIGASPDVSSTYLDPYYLVELLPTNSWAKIYIPLSALVTAYPTATDFRIAIKASLPTGQNSGFVLLDNIKVVTD